MIRADQKLRYTYIIILTALGGKGSYVEGMNAGADDFMTKPLDIEMMNVRLKVGERVLNLQSALQRLEGLLPICSYCKRIRDEQGVWQSLEAYISIRSGALFSHSICSDCETRVFDRKIQRRA